MMTIICMVCVFGYAMTALVGCMLMNSAMNVFVVVSGVVLTMISLIGLFGVLWAYDDEFDYKEDK